MSSKINSNGFGAIPGVTTPTAEGCETDQTAGVIPSVQTGIPAGVDPSAYLSGAAGAAGAQLPGNLSAYAAQANPQDSFEAMSPDQQGQIDADGVAQVAAQNLGQASQMIVSVLRDNPMKLSDKDLAKFRKSFMENLFKENPDAARAGLRAAQKDVDKLHDSERDGIKNKIAGAILGHGLFGFGSNRGDHFDQATDKVNDFISKDLKGDVSNIRSVDDIDKLSENISKAENEGGGYKHMKHTATAVGGMAGAVVAGAALAPFTGGMSLGVTAAAIGGASAVGAVATKELVGGRDYNTGQAFKDGVTQFAAGAVGAGVAGGAGSFLGEFGGHVIAKGAIQGAAAGFTAGGTYGATAAKLNGASWGDSFSAGMKGAKMGAMLGGVLGGGVAAASTFGSQAGAEAGSTGAANEAAETTAVEGKGAGGETSAGEAEAASQGRIRSWFSDKFGSISDKWSAIKGRLPFLRNAPGETVDPAAATEARFGNYSEEELGKIQDLIAQTKMNPGYTGTNEGQAVLSALNEAHPDLPPLTATDLIYGNVSENVASGAAFQTQQAMQEGFGRLNAEELTGAKALVAKLRTGLDDGGVDPDGPVAANVDPANVETLNAINAKLGTKWTMDDLQGALGDRLLGFKPGGANIAGMSEADRALLAKATRYPALAKTDGILEGLNEKYNLEITPDNAAAARLSDLNSEDIGALHDMASKVAEGNGYGGSSDGLAALKAFNAEHPGLNIGMDELGPNSPLGKILLGSDDEALAVDSSTPKAAQQSTAEKIIDRIRARIGKPAGAKVDYDDPATAFKYDSFKLQSYRDLQAKISDDFGGETPDSSAIKSAMEKIDAFNKENDVNIKYGDFNDQLKVADPAEDSGMLSNLKAKLSKFTSRFTRPVGAARNAAGNLGDRLYPDPDSADFQAWKEWGGKVDEAASSAGKGVATEDAIGADSELRTMTNQLKAGLSNEDDAAMVTATKAQLRTAWQASAGNDSAQDLLRPLMDEAGYGPGDQLALSMAGRFGTVGHAVTDFAGNAVGSVGRQLYGADGVALAKGIGAAVPAGFGGLLNLPYFTDPFAMMPAMDPYTGNGQLRGAAAATTPVATTPDTGSGTSGGGTGGFGSGTGGFGSGSGGGFGTPDDPAAIAAGIVGAGQGNGYGFGAPPVIIVNQAAPAVAPAAAKPAAPASTGPSLADIQAQVATHYTYRQGASGADVKNLQHLLNSAGDGISIPEDGQFGPGTRAAVFKYQSDLGLIDKDGIVGAETWSSLLSNGAIRMPPGVAGTMGYAPMPASAVGANRVIVG